MTFQGALLRGRVYSALIPALKSEKYFIIVSNNRRNNALGSALAVRLTTSPKPFMPSIVEMPAGEVVTGRAVCDDIYELFADEIRQDLGGLTSKTMAEISNGLRSALNL